MCEAKLAIGIIERIMKKLLEKYSKLLVFSCSRCRYLPSDKLTMINDFV